MSNPHLHLEMENGATVKDWLGTAGVAARMANLHIEAVRSGEAQPGQALELAENELQRALDEVFAVRLRLMKR